MKPIHILTPLCAAAALLLAQPPAMAQGTPRILTEFPSYWENEAIQIYYFNGPGNATDWVGIYPEGIVPGSVGSTVWQYTPTPTGSPLFEGGLPTPGVWDAHLLLNDGYEIAASTSFTVLEFWQPLLRPNKRIYAPGEPIDITFVNGWGMAKDWIGIYKQGEVPGGVGSTLWYYVDGTKSGDTAGIYESMITFAEGLAAPGAYDVYYLIDDGFTAHVMASFWVEEATAATPTVTEVRPAHNSTGVSPELAFSAKITNGDSSVVPGSIELRINGEVVTVEQTPGENELILSYTRPGLLPPSSTHTYLLTFQDDAVPPNDFSVDGTFTIAQYENIVLPEPILFEDFEDVAPGELPAGWTSVSYNQVINFDLDLGNLDSLSYANWVVVEAQRFNEPFVTYSNPESASTDYLRVLSHNPLNVLNGSLIEGPLPQNRFVFGNSGYRSDGSQILTLLTPDFDLTGHSDVHLSFFSIWEQNQDSMAVAEYSIDQGVSWLPIVYLLHVADILTVTDEVTGETNIDVEATLTTEYGDVATFIDPVTFEFKGGKYGDFIAAPISQDLAPFFQGRLDDNPVESKRIELFRLPAADNQATVRFRFLHAGGDSWYWGIDNFGLYSIPEGSGETPTLAIGISEGPLVTIFWSGEPTGWTLVSGESIDGPWTPVDGVVGNSVEVTPGDDLRVYQLVPTP